MIMAPSVLRWIGSLNPRLEEDKKSKKKKKLENRNWKLFVTNLHIIDQQHTII